MPGAGPGDVVVGAWLALVAIAGIFIGLHVGEVQTRVPATVAADRDPDKPVVADFGT